MAAAILKVWSCDQNTKILINNSEADFITTFLCLFTAFDTRNIHFPLTGVYFSQNSVIYTFDID